MSGRSRSASLLLASIAVATGCAPDPSYWTRALTDADPFQRVMAAAALGEVDPEDAPRAVGALINALDREQSDFRPRVVSSLARQIPSAIPVLADSIPTQVLGLEMREEGIRDALEECRERLVPILVDALGETEREEDDRALTLLAWFRSPPVEEIVDRLARDRGPIPARTRARAAIALGNMGASARPAIPALVDLLGEEDEVVRREAKEALSRVDPGSSFQTWAARLASSEPEERETALEYLCHELAEAAPAFVADLDRKELGPALRALRALSSLADCAGARQEIAEASGRALDLWRSGLAGEVDETRLRALEAALADELASVRCCAALALGRLGDRAVPARPALARLVTSGPPVVRDAARLALRRIDGR